MSDCVDRLPSDLLDFIQDEQQASIAKLLEIWERPLAEKLQTGWSQRFGIVTPYLAQSRAVRTLLTQQLGATAAGDVVADTVERMQGQGTGAGHPIAGERRRWTI